VAPLHRTRAETRDVEAAALSRDVRRTAPDHRTPAAASRGGVDAREPLEVVAQDPSDRSGDRDAGRPPARADGADDLAGFDGLGGRGDGRLLDGRSNADRRPGVAVVGQTGDARRGDREGADAGGGGEPGTSRA
jgi:hypothetical protein